jgi:hypothetical protein
MWICEVRLCTALGKGPAGLVSGLNARRDVHQHEQQSLLLTGERPWYASARECPGIRGTGRDVEVAVNHPAALISGAAVRKRAGIQRGIVGHVQDRRLGLRRAHRRRNVCVEPPLRSPIREQQVVPRLGEVKRTELG